MNRKSPYFGFRFLMFAASLMFSTISSPREQRLHAQSQLAEEPIGCLRDLRISGKSRFCSEHIPLDLGDQTCEAAMIDLAGFLSSERATEFGFPGDINFQSSGTSNTTAYFLNTYADPATVLRAVKPVSPSIAIRGQLVPERELFDLVEIILPSFKSTKNLQEATMRWSIINAEGIVLRKSSEECAAHRLVIKSYQPVWRVVKRVCSALNKCGNPSAFCAELLREPLE